MSIRADADIIISVISHGQADWIVDLLDDLERIPTPVSVILTVNRPESAAAHLSPRPGLLKLFNGRTRGFGANHNSAFQHSASRWFCILNPDIRLPEDPFPGLLNAGGPGLGAIAPLMVSADGQREDNARCFPSPAGLMRKALGQHDGRVHLSDEPVQAVDWVGGMFLLLPATAFEAVGGFDEGFYLYYEDVDICARLWRKGFSVQLVSAVSVVHHAQRMSRHKLRYMAWHMRSATRYFLKHTGRHPRPAKVLAG